MDIFFDEHKLLLTELLKGGVEFMLVGGYAVNIYGYVRATHDMDIWLKPDNSNKFRLIKILEDKGFNKEDLNFIMNQDFEKPFVFHIGMAPLKVDFLTGLSNINYTDANKEKMLLPLKDLQIPVIHLHHLILSKMSSNRLKDKADIEELQKINRL